MRRGSTAGFTLMEVIVTLLILTVVSLLMTGIVPATITGMHRASMRANATVLANNELEQLRQRGFGKIVPYQSTEAIAIAGTDYSYEVQVDPVRMSDGSQMDPDVAKRVSVLVRWEGRRGPQQLTSRMVIFKRI